MTLCWVVPMCDVNSNLKTGVVSVRMSVSACSNLFVISIFCSSVHLPYIASVNDCSTPFTIVFIFNFTAFIRCGC